MKCVFRLIVFFSIFWYTLSYAKEVITLDSKVVSATVFNNRAIVTREAKIDLNSGYHQLVFSNLTPDFLDESVRVSGKGSAQLKILDVKVKTEFTADIQEETLRKLQNKLDSLQTEDKIASDHIAVLESQKTFIESLRAESVKDINQNIVINKPEISDWQNILSFFDRNLSELYKGLREQNFIKKGIAHEIKAVEKKIRQSSSQNDRRYKRIIVDVSVNQPGEIAIQSSYLVNQASWYPLYDARVFSDTKEVEFTYYGMIQQNTGEDWNDVTITLSTAQPLSAQNIPELSEWHVDLFQSRKDNNKQRANRFSMIIYRSYRSDANIPAGHGSISGHIVDVDSRKPLPGANVILEGTSLGAATNTIGNFTIKNVPAGDYAISIRFIGYQPANTTIQVREKQILYLESSLQSDFLEYDAVVVIAEEEAPVPEDEISYSLADVQTNLTSAEFNIPTKNDVPSDNATHKMAITIQKFDVKFEYLTIPKLAQKTFLKGKLVNQSEYPFLAGFSNVFFENSFVNKSYLDTIVPNDTFELSLGVDDAIRVERKLINKYSEKKGIFGGKNKVTYEYEIRITNNKSTEESILVLDQIPISMNEKIKVELLQPDKKNIQIDSNSKQISWHRKIRPGEEIVLPLKYRVEYPSSSKVAGLE